MHGSECSDGRVTVSEPEAASFVATSHVGDYGSELRDIFGLRHIDTFEFRLFVNDDQVTLLAVAESDSTVGTVLNLTFPASVSTDHDRRSGELGVSVYATKGWSIGQHRSGVLFLDGRLRYADRDVLFAYELAQVEVRFATFFDLADHDSSLSGVYVRHERESALRLS